MYMYMCATGTMLLANWVVWCATSWWRMSSFGLRISWVKDTSRLVPFKPFPGIVHRPRPICEYSTCCETGRKGHDGQRFALSCAKLD